MYCVPCCPCYTGAIHVEHTCRVHFGQNLMFWTKYLNILFKFVWKACFQMVFIMCSVCHVFSYIQAFHVRQTCRVHFVLNKIFKCFGQIRLKTMYQMVFIMCSVCHVFSYTLAFSVQQTCRVRFNENLMFWTEYLTILFQMVRNS